MISRRSFLGAAAALPGCTVIGLAPPNDAGPVPDGGPFTLPAFDQAMSGFLSSHGVPGGALAVMKDGRLVYAQGYGIADRDSGDPVKAGSLFRIASVTKPFTAVAILQLAEAGMLDLDAPALPIVNRQPLPSRTLNPALASITVRQLLHHTGGWDRDQLSWDPMFASIEIAGVVGVPSPPGPIEIVRYMLSEPLQHDPGTTYVYSNFGYCLLGRIIERVTGMTYPDYVKAHVLAPCGIVRMQQGATLPAGRLPDEVRYYSVGDAMGPSVFASVPGDVPWPYGGFDLEAMDSHGAWVTSAIDLMRFASTLERGPAPLLSSLDTLYEPPAAPAARNAAGNLTSPYYACGWLRTKVGTNRYNTWHDGSLDGTRAWLVQRADGVSWAALFNMRTDSATVSDGDIDSALHAAADSIAAWPSWDLFAQYP